MQLKPILPNTKVKRLNLKLSIVRKRVHLVIDLRLCEIKLELGDNHHKPRNRIQYLNQWEDYKEKKSI